MLVNILVSNTSAPTPPPLPLPPILFQHKEDEKIKEDFLLLLKLVRFGET